MKYGIALLLGLAAGAAIAFGFLFYNPLLAKASLSPLEVSDHQQLTLNYSAVAENSIVFTNDGESRMHPLLRYWRIWKRYPAKVLQLYEAPIRQTDTLVTILHDGRNLPAGIGVKFSSLSESTRVLNGEALMNSAWYVYLPGQGTMLIEQSENHWAFLREIVIPAHWSSDDTWFGNWRGTITHGPDALHTGRVHGGSGRFEGLKFEAIETISAKAYSAENGPVAMDGQLTIELSVEIDESIDESIDAEVPATAQAE